MSLPANFLYLNAPDMPRMIAEALKIYGTKEISGPVDNQLIMSWATEFGIRDIYSHDEVAWCSLAHAIVAKRAGKPVPFTRFELLRAASWSLMKTSTEPRWGTIIPVGGEMVGDTCVFIRPEGHHVGLYVAESKETLFILGGNQTNMYKISEIGKERLIAVRRPVFQIGQPATVKKMFLGSDGNVSQNEA